MANFHFNGYYLTAALLVACTIVGIAVAARWRREVDEDLAPTTTKDLLDPLEKAYHSGLMHPEEIERIRASVQGTPAVEVSVPRPRSPVKPANSAPERGSDPLVDDDLDRGPVGRGGEAG